MTHPERVAASIRRALRDDGVWLIADIKAYPSFAENVAQNPMASLMYGFSVLTCMSSALSEPGGAGLGTLGLPEPRARALAAEAGFARFQRLEVGAPGERVLRGAAGLSAATARAASRPRRPARRV